MKNFLSDIFWYIAIIALFVVIMFFAMSNYKIILFLICLGSIAILVVTFPIIAISSFNKNVLKETKEEK